MWITLQVESGSAPALPDGWAQPQPSPFSDRPSRRDGRSSHPSCQRCGAPSASGLGEPIEGDCTTARVNGEWPRVCRIRNHQRRALICVDLPYESDDTRGFQRQSNAQSLTDDRRLNSAAARQSLASAINSVMVISIAAAILRTETIPGFWPPLSMLLMYDRSVSAM